MLWLSVLIGTIGFVMIVPTILQARDGEPLNAVMGSIAFGATAFGLMGLIISPFAPRFRMKLLLALVVGAAVGALHREILLAIRGDVEEDLESDATEVAPQSAALPVVDLDEPQSSPGPNY